METCVLIPTELSLVLRPEPNDENRRSFVPEMGATLWSNKSLHPGRTFYPEEGRITLEKLEIYTVLKDKDLRFQFGCYDEIHEIDEEEVRHCNWVRFLQASNSLDEVNIVGVKVDNEVVFQVVKVIPPNTELRAFFDDGQQVEPPEPQPEQIISSSSKNDNTSPEANTSEARANAAHTPWKSPESPRSMSARSLLTPPSDKDDDIKSVNSDMTCASEESHQSSKSGTSANLSFGGESRPQIGLTPTFHSPGHMIMPLGSRLISPSSLMCSPPGLTPTSPHKTTPKSSDDSLTPSRGPVPPRRNRERTWLPCDVCGKKFDRPSLLRRHMRTHTGEKPHACDVCGKAFSTSSSLNTHRRIHSGEKPHQCQICGKRFTASSNLYYHRMTHNKEKPHKCTLCSKSFPTPGDLKSHMYVHNGSWPYKCDICNRGFSKQTNLKNHLLLHTGDKPHECPLCGKRFALQCNLKTHLKTHEGEPQEECYKCGKVFLVSSNQVINGYCRHCLPKMTGPIKPIPTNPATRGHTLFSVESLASSSVQHPPVSLGVTSPPTSSVTMDGVHGYAMLNPAHSNMAAMSGIPVPVHHPGNGLLHYGNGISWHKLVPQQY